MPVSFLARPLEQVETLSGVPDAAIDLQPAPGWQRGDNG